MSIVPSKKVQRSSGSKGKSHYSTKSLRGGKPRTKLAKYWRGKLIKSINFHNKMFITSKDIESMIKWKTKNKFSPTAISRKKTTPALTRKMGHGGTTKSYSGVSYKKKSYLPGHPIDEGPGSPGSGYG